MILTFDCDGVIAAMGPADLDPSLRTYEGYRNKAVMDGFDVAIFNHLTCFHNCYVVTARSFPQAIDCTRNWLYDNGVYLYSLAGVIAAEGAPGHSTATKHTVLNWIGPAYHFDDHPGVVERMGEKGVLYLNPAFDDNVYAYNQLPPNRRVKSWMEIKCLVEGDEW